MYHYLNQTALFQWIVWLMNMLKTGESAYEGTFFEYVISPNPLPLPSNLIDI